MYLIHFFNSIYYVILPVFSFLYQQLAPLLLLLFYLLDNLDPTLKISPKLLTFTNVKTFRRIKATLFFSIQPS